MKVSFPVICSMSGVDYAKLQAIAVNVGLDPRVIDAMYTGILVRRGPVSKILKALSEHTGKKWDLSNVKVALLPTFKEVHEKHRFDLDKLSTSLDVPFAMIDMMLEGAPVSMEDARLVLRAVSEETRTRYTLDNVDVIIKEVQHA